MSGSSALRVIVVGAGVLGSSIALVLAQAGARVRLVDPARPGDNASGVAAGMLAPAFETLLDPLSAGHFPLLRQARDLWPAFIKRLADAPIGLQRSGAIWIDPGDLASLDHKMEGLARLGAASERLTPARVAALVPDLASAAGGGAFTAEDWRLDAWAALAAILRAGEAAGVELIAAKVAAVETGAVILKDGRRLPAEAIVLAVGAGQTPLAPELAWISPVKGHILRYADAAAVGPIVRCPGGYGVMAGDGVLVGATMQPGCADRAIEPAKVAQLSRLAAELFPRLAAATPSAAAAVRAATPDGLPLVGPSAVAGLFLAVGARRNGWLLAPSAAAMMKAHLFGDDPGPWAAHFDARRFDRPGP